MRINVAWWILFIVLMVVFISSLFIGMCVVLVVWAPNVPATVGLMQYLGLMSIIIGTIMAYILTRMVEGTRE